MYMRPFKGVPDNDASGKQKLDGNGNPVWKEKGWWFHGQYNEPPEAGQFLEVPSGGTLKAVIANHKNLTPWSWNRPEDLAYPFAAYCDDQNTCKSRYDQTGIAGMLHLPNQRLNTPEADIKAMGCAFAIAYKSNIDDIQPEDFTVISIFGKCPYKKTADFQIPAGLKACPPEGCHCMWGWVHDNTGQMENYLTGFRCKVTGQIGNKEIGKPQPARNCDNGGCINGPKQLHYWLQKERNNQFGDWWHPPFYNAQYGFKEGAQNDIFVGAAARSLDAGEGFNSTAKRAHPRDFTISV